MKDKQSRVRVAKLVEQDDHVGDLIVGDRITHGFLILNGPLDRVLDGTKTTVT